MKLGDVMKLSKGNLIAIKDDEEYIIAGVQNYGAGILNKRNVKGNQLNMKKYQLIKPNQLMWCKVDTKNGAFGVTKLVHTNSLASTNMALADIDTSKCHPEFIEYLFRISFFHEQITKASSGTTNRKYLTPKQLFENIEIPNFNKSEQLKWIEKVDTIINSGISSELTHQLALVKKLRQQFLQDAVQGKLLTHVPSQIDSGESASELLKKIKAEKAKLVAEKKLKKEKELPPIKPEEIPFEIPEDWVWCRLGEICNFITDGDHQAPPQSKSGIPFIVISNIKNNLLKFEETRFVTEAYYNNLSNEKKPQNGDILYTVTGSFGIPVILEDVPNFCVQRHIGIIKPNQLISNKWLYFFLKSPFLFNQATNGAWGIAQRTIPLQVIRNYLVPTPSYKEQIYIVEKLEELMKYCDGLESSIKESQAQNEKLLQQVLREALRG